MTTGESTAERAPGAAEQAAPAARRGPEARNGRQSPERLAAEVPSALVLTWATVATLWGRDLRRFFRQPSRVVGALAQPLIFWVVIGGGFAGSFAVAGAAEVGYLEYFFPGVVMMIVLFTSIFSTMSVIEDRHAGFLQAVLVAPAPRVALVLGKTLGGTTIAVVQGGIFLALAPYADFPFAQVDWLSAALILVGASIALTALGFAIAWALDSTQGYHAIMSVLLIPLWIVSGAMFPAGKSGAMAEVMRANPVSYAVSGLRRALYGGELPAGVGVPGASAARELTVTLGFALLMVALAAFALRAPSRRGKPAKAAATR